MCQGNGGWESSSSLPSTDDSTGALPAGDRLNEAFEHPNSHPYDTLSDLSRDVKALLATLR